MRIGSLKRGLGLLNIALVAGIVAMAFFFANRVTPRSSGELAGSLPDGAAGVETPRPIPLGQLPLLWELNVNGDPTTTREPPRSTPATDPPERTHRLVSTWVPVTRRQQGFAQYVRIGETELLDVAVGQFLTGRWQLVRIEEDRALLRNRALDREVWMAAFRTAPPGVPTGPPGRLADPPRRLPFSEEAGTISLQPREIDHWRKSGAEELRKIALRPVVDTKTGKPLGLYVASIEEDSALYELGVRANDTVRSVNAVVISSRTALLEYMRGDGRNLERYVFEVERKGRTIAVTVNLRK